MQRYIVAVLMGVSLTKSTTRYFFRSIWFHFVITTPILLLLIVKQSVITIYVMYNGTYCHMYMLAVIIVPIEYTGYGIRIYVCWYSTRFPYIIRCSCCLTVIRGGSRGGRTRRAPPKIGKNMIFWHKIVIYHTKYPKNVRASLRSAQFF
jgi:hypothetical protein